MLVTPVTRHTRHKIPDEYYVFITRLKLFLYSMDAAARKRKSREKLKSDPEKWNSFLERERKRDQLRRNKHKNVLRENKTKLEESRVASKIRQRKCRDKKKMTLKKKENINTPSLGTYKCIQTLSKATRKVEKSLPTSPSKIQAVVLQLAKRTLPQGMINETRIATTAKSLPDEHVTLVKAFYESDDISRQTPNRKDVIRVKASNGEKTTVPIKHLLMTVSEVYELFKQKHPKIKIKRSKFFALRPVHVRVISEIPHNVCVCVYHANFAYLFDAVKNILDSTISTPSQLLKEICCGMDNEKCIHGTCRSCYDVSDVVNLKVDLNVQTQWKQWFKSTDGWLQIQKVQGSKKELLQEIEKQIPKYKVHCNIKAKQSSFFEEMKLKTSETDAVVQVDFAENFSIISQDEIQSAHWRHPQVTMFTCCVWLKKGQQMLNYVIVSSDLSHDSIAVWFYLKKIFGHIKAKYSALQKITVFSDGSAAQFKNKRTVSSVYYSMEDWGVKVDWAFFATSHGKGAVDGLGAVAKRSLWNAIKTRQVQINDARDCYKYLSDSTKSIIYLFVSSNDKNEFKELLMLRWENLNDLRGIRSHHFFKHCGGKLISYGKTGYSQAKTTILFKNKVMYKDVYEDCEED